MPSSRSRSVPHRFWQCWPPCALRSTLFPNCQGNPEPNVGENQGQGCDYPTASRTKNAGIERMGITMSHADAGAELLARATGLVPVAAWTWNVGADTADWSDELYELLGVEP